ncbi:MAG: 5'-nucleotidase C-terminal domain-containing protein [Actinomycetaceae bacterium]|nr:5'-nucleotidase C-terminal domain-containing protein [Actinomycetaceae bacterium]
MKRSVHALAAGAIATLALVVSPLVALADTPVDENPGSTTENVNTELSKAPTEETEVKEDSVKLEGDASEKESPKESGSAKEEAKSNDDTSKEGTSGGGTSEEGDSKDESSQSEKTPDIVTLDLYNMTDIHGHIEKVYDKDKKKYTEAGISAVACYVKEAEKNNPNSVFTLLGDNIGASPITSGLADDNPTIAALNKANVFASAIGNHEFDKGQEALQHRLAGTGGYTKVEFDYLASNIMVGDTNDTLFEPYKIWVSEDESIRIGFIAGIEDDAPTKVFPGTFDGLRFENAAEKINYYAAQLKDGKKDNGEADIVIALYDNDATISAPRMSEHVDGLMGGDTHKPVAKLLPRKDGTEIPVTTSGSFTDNLANIRLTYDKNNKKILEAETILIPANKIVTDCAGDEEVDEIVNKAITDVDPLKNRVIIESDSKFMRGIQETQKEGVTSTGDNRGVESTAGDLVADAMKYGISPNEGESVDIGIINAGGLRADLVPENGKITAGGVFALAPFSNQVGYVKMTGAQFKTLLEQQWKKLGEKSTRPVLKLGLSSNVQYTFDPSKKYDPEIDDARRITTVTVDGAPIDDNKVYTVGSVTFLLQGGDSFDIFKEKSVASTFKITEGLDREIIEKYLKANPTVEPREAVSSVGVTATNELAGANSKIKIALRGLSFTQKDENAPKKVTVKLGDHEVLADVNNTLFDPNAENENAIVTADGAGYLDEPAEFSLAKVCGSADGKLTLPITVFDDRGDALVDEYQGLTHEVDCSTPTEPTEEGNTSAPAPEKKPQGKLAKTGVDAYTGAGIALALMAMGASLLAVRRRNA